jgi:hypothetical protein
MKARDDISPLNTPGVKMYWLTMSTRFKARLYQQGVSKSLIKQVRSCKKRQKGRFNISTKARKTKNSDNRRLNLAKLVWAQQISVFFFFFF